MDDSGFFSVQVITRALSVWGLDLLPLNSSNPEAVRAKSSAISATAYICNYRFINFTTLFCKKNILTENIGLLFDVLEVNGSI